MAASPRDAEGDRLVVRSEPQKSDGDAVVYADLPSRLAAYLIDAIALTVILFGLLIVLSVVLGPTIHFRQPADVLKAHITVNHGRAIIDAIVATIANAAYFVLSWRSLGGSPGQRLLGIRIGRAMDGGRIELRPAFIRWLLMGSAFGVLIVLVDGIVPGLRASVAALAVVWQVILLLTVARSPRKQGIHDRAAGTVVVRVARLARWPAADEQTA
jgi:uncharacterized RDD family membrane protein YckC